MPHPGQSTRGSWQGSREKKREKGRDGQKMESSAVCGTGLSACRGAARASAARGVRVFSACLLTGHPKLVKRPSAAGGGLLRELSVPLGERREKGTGRRRILHAKVALSPLPRGCWSQGRGAGVRDRPGGRGSKEVGQLTHPAYAVHASSADSGNREGRPLLPNRAASSANKGR